MAKVINVIYKVDDKALLKAKSEIQGIEKETKDSEKEMLKLDKAIQKAGNDGGKSFLNFKNIIGAVSVTALVAGLTQIGKKILDLGIKQEQLNIAFTTFLGSASKAKVLLADLTKFSIITPFTPDQVNNAAKALLAFGVQGKEIIPTLKMLGDVSSGTGKDLTEMAIIFGQIRSTGRLMGQDLLQLINAGFNPLQVISEKTGKSVAVLKQEMEKGLITFDMVSDAFKTATSEGGLFFNLMEKQSQSVGGKLSTIEGNIEEIGKKLFENNQGPIADLVGATAELSSNIEGIANFLNAIVNTMGITWLAKLYSATNDAANETERLKNEELQLQLVLAKGDLDSAFTAEMRANAIKKIIDLSKQLGQLPTGTTEDPLPWATDGKAGDINKVAKATEADAKALEKRAKALQAINKQLGFTTAADKFKENAADEEKESKRKSDAITRELKQDADRAEVLKANNKDMEDEKIRIAEEAAEERIRIADEEAKRKAEIERAFMDFAIDSLQQILYASLLTSEEDFSAQREKFDREMLLAGDNERAKGEIRLREEEAEKAFRERQKKAEKENALKRIAIDTAINVIRSITNNGGIPLGLPFGALALAAGVLQAATVRKLKDGEVGIKGKGTSTSDSIPAMLSVGESVINADATKKSSRLLEAINDRKIDDRILYKIAANGGRQANVFDDSRIVDAINKNKVDYDTHGYTIMKGIQKGKNFKLFIRSKVQGY